MRPLSVPAFSSMTALISVGLREWIACIEGAPARTAGRFAECLGLAQPTRRAGFELYLTCKIDSDCQDAGLAAALAADHRVGAAAEERLPAA